MSDRNLHHLTPSAEALEADENGRRLALAMEREMLAALQSPSFVPPALDEESIKRIASRLLDAQGNIIAAANQVPLEGEEELHSWFNALITGLNQVGAMLAQRGERS